MTAACDAVQLALVEGSLREDLREHLLGCDECRFVASLSRQLGEGRPTPDDLAPTLDRYRLLEQLGRGGQGVVYRAVDLETDDAVAVKIGPLRSPDDKALEVAHARRIRHGNICRVFHADRHGDLRVVVMELLDGPTLLEALPQLSWKDRLRIFRAICAGVRAAHEAGVLHLDLKPQNVILREGRDPVVTDFGLSARVGSEGASATGGTPAYMAPEQVRGGPVDARADVFALGRILGQLSGRRLRAVVRRATAPSPGDRFASVENLLVAIDRRVARGRRAARATLALGALLASAGALAFLVPPPRGRRVTVDPSRWEPDLVPSPAWNVARRAILTASHPGFACGQNLSDLVDGLTEYHDWRHGFAFPPAKGACVSLQALGTCGTEKPDSFLCGDQQVLTRRVREASAEDRKRLGQWTPPMPCGERWIDLDLGRSRRVRAVRAWHHGREHFPRRLDVLLDGRPIFQAADFLPRGSAWDARGYDSGPETADFPPTLARHVRVLIDSCTTPDPAIGHGWLYELEVFADLPWYEAWWNVLRPI